MKQIIEQAKKTYSLEDCTFTTVSGHEGGRNQKMMIIQCTSQDIHTLAVLNKRLIEDEKSDNPMSPDELEKRMTDFLSSEYNAYFFKEAEEIVGYALIRHTCTPLYLRQFYIDRTYRRKHYGEKAFHELLKLLQVDTINIDVLPWNEGGLR